MSVESLLNERHAAAGCILEGRLADCEVFTGLKGQKFEKFRFLQMTKI